MDKQELKKQGGRWLEVVREWIIWKGLANYCYDFENKTESLALDFTVKDIEELASKIAISVLHLKPIGGAWLGAAREWVKRNCVNGDTVTWGSNDVLRHDFTAGDLEEFALDVAFTAWKNSDHEGYRP